MSSRSCSFTSRCPRPTGHVAAIALSTLVLLLLLPSASMAQSLPSPWASRDIGSPALAGSATSSAGAFTVQAAGTDIWGTSDQFHFAYQTLSGDGEVVARVDSITAADVWSKAGVMMRESLAASSRHAFVLVSAARGSAFQRRTPSTGSPTLHTSGGNVSAPYWVRLQRLGNTFRAYDSGNGSTWRLIGTETIAMASTIHVGLAATSHNVSTRTTARFSNVRLSTGSQNQPPTVQITAPANNATFEAPASVTMTASASDPDGAVSRVDFYEGTRLLGSDTTAPFSVTTNLSAGSYTLTARATDNAGATATSGSIAIRIVDPAGPLPAPWSSQDVGGASPRGAASYSSGQFTIDAGGTDIWGTADQFHFVHQWLTGDGDIVARVEGLTRADEWSKAGVMMRETLTAGSRHAYAMTSASYGGAFQRRTATSGSSLHTSGTLPAGPIWVRLQRQGDVFRAYESTDGANWRLIGSQTISMTPTIYVGLAVTSHNTARTTTATMTNVRFTAGAEGGSAPFSGTPAAVPGLIQAENFDLGGQGVGHYDNTPGNAGGQYRSTDVDIERTSDTGGGYNIGWASAGEWLQYTVNVATAGTYTLEARVASNGSGGAFHLETNGTNVTGSMTIPNTGGWQVWQTLTRSVTLAAGVQRFRVVLDSNGSGGAVGNFNYFRLVSGSSGNTPPSVSLTSPSNGATFTAPATITLNAAASDPGGSVTRVDFYAGTTLLGSDTLSPYSIGWSSVPAGSYVLTARAIDNEGATTTSAPVTVTVSGTTNQPPTVSLSSPANGATFGAPRTVTLAASATDGDGTIARVEFYVGSTLIATDTTSPYTASWNVLTAGSYTLTARATDNAGATRTSTAVTVTASPTRAAFTPPSDHATAVTSYLLEIYTAGSTPGTSAPARSHNIGKPSVINGEITVDITAILQPLAPGSYFATMGAVRSTGTTRSTPSNGFDR